ncbi:ABC transporter ATP-binding protein [Taylorella asinigenitalis]|uniref:ABC transporter ATP-binding protein n=1 Tax=Taylorella asinigenitalis TaxID=84590 RepID=UPI00048DF6ED|nr:ATP-binding cassette domain-containing protein [Taylorella asinigenitalis]
MLEISELLITRGEGSQAFEIELSHFVANYGEAVALCGQSGCGKSSILEVIGLILKPDSLKAYSLGSEDIATPILNAQHAKLAKLRARNFGFMLQTGGLLPYLSSLENIALSCKIIGEELDEPWLSPIIDRLGASHLLSKYPSQLSIGERQRVSFLRSIAHKPQVLLADEPTAALDPHKADELFDIILESVAELEMCAIIVTHDWSHVVKHALPSYTAEVYESRSVFSKVQL